MRQQHTLMKFDPATGAEKPYPSHADQWRDWHGRRTAWLFNPWTGERRFTEDVGSDIGGQLIIPPGEPVYAADDAGPEQGNRDIRIIELERLLARAVKNLDWPADRDRAQLLLDNIYESKSARLDDVPAKP